MGNILPFPQSHPAGPEFLHSPHALNHQLWDHVVNLTGISFPSDLMTEMMDLTSDLVGTGIPFLDYKSYAERIFFPGHRESPLQRDLDIPECRRQTVEQGLVQLSNLLNSKLFLTKVMSLSACSLLWGQGHVPGSWCQEGGSVC